MTAFETRRPRLDAPATPLPYGRDYAMTLHRWLQRFRTNSSAVRALGFDERFIRMWEFYLAYCEAGFASGYLDVHQLVLER